MPGGAPPEPCEPFEEGGGPNEGGPAIIGMKFGGGLPASGAPGGAPAKLGGNGGCPLGMNGGGPGRQLSETAVELSIMCTYHLGSHLEEASCLAEEEKEEHPSFQEEETHQEGKAGRLQWMRFGHGISL